MGLFKDLFGREPEAPRSAEEPATDHIHASDIRAALGRKLGVSKRNARRIYACLFDPSTGIISAAVDQGKDVHLRGLGKFTRRERSAGVGRNPRTGQRIQIPARHYPAFQVSALWKRIIRQPGTEATRKGQIA